MCIRAKYTFFMNKMVIGGVVAVLGLGGVLMFTSSQKQAQLDEKMKAEEKAMMEKEQMEMADKKVMEKETMEKDSMMSPDATNTMMKKDAVTEEGKMMTDTKVGLMEKGSYEVYDASKLTLAEKGDVVLFFKASWCPSCRTVDADIKSNLSEIPDSLTILEVDYDTATEMRTKYGVTTQHTFVQVAADGTLIKKWSGGATLANIVTQVQ